MIVYKLLQSVERYHTYLKLYFTHSRNNFCPSGPPRRNRNQNRAGAPSWCSLAPVTHAKIESMTDLLPLSPHPDSLPRHALPLSSAHRSRVPFSCAGTSYAEPASAVGSFSSRCSRSRSRLSLKWPTIGVLVKMFGYLFFVSQVSAYSQK